MEQPFTYERYLEDRRTQEMPTQKLWTPPSAPVPPVPAPTFAKTPRIVPAAPAPTEPEPTPPSAFFSTVFVLAIVSGWFVCLFYFPKLTLMATAAYWIADLLYCLVKGFVSDKPRQKSLIEIACFLADSFSIKSSYAPTSYDKQEFEKQLQYREQYAQWEAEYNQRNGGS